MSTGSCPLPLTPLCAVGSGVKSIASGAAGGLATAVLSGIVGWILHGADWLLQHVGQAISTTTTIRVGAPWFEAHYAVMASIAGVVAVPMLMLAAVQAVLQQSPALLLRAAFVQLPLAGLLTAVAVQAVQLSLTATDALCTTVAAGDSVAQALDRIGSALVAMGVGPMPGFVATLGGLLIVGGGLVLWLELLVRAAAVYVAVLFLPLALASLVWPAASQWSRRLVETLAALVLSKFVVVAVLSLATGALGTGSGFAAVLSGAALLLLAAFTPFTLLRLLPMLEVGAALQLEGAHQRVRRAVTSLPSSAASFALGGVGEGMVPGPDPGMVGTGTVDEPGAPGPEDAGIGATDDPVGGAPGSPGPGSGGRPSAARAAAEAAALASLPPEIRGDGLVPPPGGIPLWRGDPVATKELLDRLESLDTAQPDGAGGGALPGVQNPLYGGNVPRSRFEPGPTDHWPGWPDADEEDEPELWTPSEDVDDPDIPSDYFFD